MKIALLEDLGCSPEIIKENINKLASLGHELKVYSKSSNLETLKNEVTDADILMLANMPLPAEVVQNAKNLKFVDVAFTGVDHIPMKQLRDRKIDVSNASGYANDAVAELCISFMIQLLRDLDKAQERTRTGQTKSGLTARLLKGKTVGIIGAGAIGKRVAELAKAFGATIYAHNRHPVTDKNIDRNVSLDELLANSDIISIHTPLTEETRGLIGEKELKKMKKSAVLINAGRGPVIDNSALAKALDNDTIAGAAIDVFDMEPPLPSDYPLLKAKNAILTPHLGFYSQESLDERAKIVFDNLYAWLNNKPVNLV